MKKLSFFRGIGLSFLGLGLIFNGLTGCEYTNANPSETVLQGDKAVERQEPSCFVGSSLLEVPAGGAFQIIFRADHAATGSVFFDNQTLPVSLDSQDTSAPVTIPATAGSPGVYPILGGAVALDGTRADCTAQISVTNPDDPGQEEQSELQDTLRALQEEMDAFRQTMEERASTPSCTPETDPAFCTRLGRTCDIFTGADNCGTMRSVNCGTCPVAEEPVPAPPPPPPPPPVVDAPPDVSPDPADGSPLPGIPDPRPEIPDLHPDITIFRPDRWGRIFDLLEQCEGEGMVKSAGGECVCDANHERVTLEGDQFLCSPKIGALRATLVTCDREDAATDDTIYVDFCKDPLPHHPSEADFNRCTRGTISRASGEGTSNGDLLDCPLFGGIGGIGCETGGVGGMIGGWVSDVSSAHNFDRDSTRTVTFAPADSNVWLNRDLTETSLSDIQNIRISSNGDDSWCVKKVKFEAKFAGSEAWVTFHNNPCVNRWVRHHEENAFGGLFGTGLVESSSDEDLYSPHSPDDVTYCLTVETKNETNAGTDDEANIRVKLKEARPRAQALPELATAWIDQYSEEVANPIELAGSLVVSEIKVILNPSSGLASSGFGWSDIGFPTFFGDLERGETVHPRATVPYSKDWVTHQYRIAIEGNDVWKPGTIQVIEIHPGDLEKISRHRCWADTTTPNHQMSTDDDEGPEAWPTDGYRTLVEATCDY